MANQISKRRRKRSGKKVGHDYAEAETDENVRLLCCSFQKYLHCSETVVNTTCGYETALFTKSFRGIAPGAKIINLRVLGADGSGTDAAVISAIDRAIDDMPSAPQ